MVYYKVKDNFADRKFGEILLVKNELFTKKEIEKELEEFTIADAQCVSHVRQIVFLTHPLAQPASQRFYVCTHFMFSFKLVHFLAAVAGVRPSYLCSLQ